MMSTEVKTMSDELKPGDRIRDYFICSSKEVRTDRKGDKYLLLRLSNAGGAITGKKWRVDDAFIDTFAVQDCLRIDATVGEYQGKPDYEITGIQVIPDEDIDLTRLLPVSPEDPLAMQETLAKIVDSVANNHLRALLKGMFADEKLYDAFCKAPAAKGVHHNYIHGLLEHSISVCRVSEAIAAQYEDETNRDLLVAAALLHDIGKTSEFSYTRAIEYSDPGRLLGHIILGEKIVSEAIEQLDRERGEGEPFPEELRMHLLHLVVSHHGEKEFGSPVVPHTLEGFILNYADNIDAKANIFTRLRARAAGSGDPWSDYHRLLDRFLYLKKVEE